MNDDIYKMAKVIAASKVGDVAKGMNEAGSAVELAEALVSIWDGNASTLDQASAWREVHKYMQDANLLSRFHKGSALEQVLGAIGEMRRQLSIHRCPARIGMSDPLKLWFRPERYQTEKAEKRIAELEARPLSVKLPALVTFDDLDATSKERDVIEAIAQCKGWNAAIEEAKRLNAASGIVAGGE